MPGPNEIGSLLLTRYLDAEGEWQWKAIVRISSGTDAYRAAVAMKSAIAQTLEAVIRGEAPWPGNGDHEVLNIPGARRQTPDASGESL